MTDVCVYFLNGETVNLPDCNTVNDIRVRLCYLRPQFFPPEVMILAFPDATTTILCDVDDDNYKYGGDDTNNNNNDNHSNSSIRAPSRVFAVFDERDAEKRKKEPFWVQSLQAYAAYGDTVGVSRCVERLLVLDPDFVGRQMRDAAELGDVVMVRALIENDVNIKDNAVCAVGGSSKCAPLHIASRTRNSGGTDIVRLLLERDDVEINVRDPFGKTPLHMAPFSDNEQTVAALLGKRNVDVNAKDEWGTTPLHYATCFGAENVVDLLLEYGNRDSGVEVNATNSDGETPLHWAARVGKKEVVERLVSRDDVEVNAQKDQGATPLHLAAMGGREDVIEKLLARPDIVVDLENNWGDTACDVAEEFGHKGVVELLRSYVASANVEYSLNE